MGRDKGINTQVFSSGKSELLNSCKLSSFISMATHSGAIAISTDESSWPIATQRWKQAMKCSGDREDILHRLSVSDCLSHAHTQTCTCAHAHTYKASQMSSWSLLFWTFNQLSSAHKHHCEHWNAGRFKIIQPGWSFWLEDPAFLFMLISFFSWSLLFQHLTRLTEMNILLVWG